MPSVNGGPSVTTTPNYAMVLATPPAAAGAIVNVSPSGDTTGAQDYANLLSAYNSIVGVGGTIQLQAATYYIGGNTLPIASGVTWRGQGWTLNYSNYPDWAPTRGAGTWIIGDGTAHGIAANASNGVAPYGTAAAFSGAGLTNCGVVDLGIYNCLDGIHIGSNYNPGSFWGRFSNVCAMSCTGWGVWFENCLHNEYYGINTFACAGGGQMYRASATSAILQPGNSIATALLNSTIGTAYTARGIVIEAANGTGGGLWTVQKLQSNRFGNGTITQAATMANGSPNITITDGTKFAVGMPVTTSASVNGFTANRIYFVLSNAANVITLGNTPGGAAINATGNSAVNVVTTGMAALELTCADATAGNYPYLGDVRFLDLEGGGSAKCVVFNSTGFINWFAGLVQDAGSYQSFCFRNCNARGRLVLAWACSVDIDATATVFAIDAMYGYGANSRFGYPAPAGMYWTGSGYGLNLSVYGAGAASTPSLANKQTGTGDFTYLNVPAAQKTTGLDTGTLSLNGGNGGWQVYNGAGGNTWTLPTAAAAYLGWEMGIVNTGAGTLTLACGDANGFNLQSTRTSITVGTKGGVAVKCQKTAGGTHFWSITQIVGTYSAGAITGI